MQDMEQYIEDQAAKELERRRENYVSYLIEEVFGCSSEDELQQLQTAKYYEHLLEEWEQGQYEKIEDFKAQMRKRLI